MIRYNKGDPTSDEKFIERLYDKYHRLIFFTIKKYDVTEELCEDIAQDCLVKLTEKVETLRTLPEPALASYIVATARNTTIDHWRRQTCEQKMIISFEDIIGNLSEWETPDSSLDDVIIQLEDRELVRAVWSKLDEETKRILEGKYWLEYENWELAQILGVKPDSVRMKLTRARRNLSKLLIEGGYDDKAGKIDRGL